jgi:signal transduction histidine kinase
VSSQSLPAPWVPAVRWLLTAPVRAATWRWAGFCLTGSVVAILALSAGFFGALSAVLLTVTIVGLPVMMLLLLALRAFARMERCRLAWVGITVVSPYGRDDPSASWWATLRTRLREPSTWLEVAWLVLVGPVGLIAAIISGVLWLTAGAAMTIPLWYRWLPEHRAVLESTSTAHHFTIDSAAAALPYAAAGLALIWVSAWVTVGLGRGEAMLMRSLLSGSPRQQLRRARTARQAAASGQQRLVDRLARDLHDGAQVRLVAASLDLNLAMQADNAEERDTLLRQAQASSRAALTELRDLVRGIDPPLLRERGLLGALDALAREAPQPVTIFADLPPDLPRPVQSTAYFIVAEALSNVAKHSAAASATITLRSQDGDVQVLVSDDGRGGADRNGSGLQGLRDRVHAAGGTMTVHSPPGGPTTLEARLPCE